MMYLSIPSILALGLAATSLAAPVQDKRAADSAVEKGNHYAEDLVLYTAAANASQASWITFTFRDGSPGFEMQTHCNLTVPAGQTPWTSSTYQQCDPNDPSMKEGDDVAFLYQNGVMTFRRTWYDPT